MIIFEKKLYNKFLVFFDRKEAGIKLAKFLKKKIKGNEIVYAIPAGGIPVAKYFCKELNLTFKILIVSKIVFPWNSEAGYGALTIEGDLEINEELVKYYGLSKETVEEGIRFTKEKIKKRKEIIPEKYLKIEKCETCILIDDGLASGYTMLAAIKTMKKYCKRIFIATPTSSDSAVNLLKKYCDEIFVLNLRTIYPFAVADAYENWYDLTEKDIIEILKDC